MNIVFNLALFFIALYMIMDVAIRGDGTSRPEVQLVAGSGLVLMLLYNGYYLTSRYRITRFWPFIKVWIYFVGVLFVYYILAFIDVPSSSAVASHRNALVMIYCLSALILTYQGVVKGHFTDSKMSLLIVVLLINGLLEIFYGFINITIKQGVELVNTSAGYVFLMITPLLMWRYRRHNLWIFLVMLLLTAMTGKRGALVVFAILVIYSLVNFKTLRKYLSVNLKTFVFIGFIAIGGAFVIETSIENLQYRFANIVHQEKGTIGSGRSVFWVDILKFWSDGSVANLFWGNGFYSTIAAVGKIAHNDFLQFLADFGLIGLFFYLYFLSRFYMVSRKSKNIDPYLGYLLTLCFLILVGRGLISGTIRTDSINLTVSIGYLLAVTSLVRGRNA